MRSLGYGFLQNLQIPAGASPGQPYVFIGQDVPAELRTYYGGVSAGVVGCLLFYSPVDGFGRVAYHYLALLDVSSPGLLVYGWGRSDGTVDELGYWDSNAAGATGASALFYDSGHGGIGGIETWHDVSTGVGFQNGWTNLGGGRALAAYRNLASPPHGTEIRGVLVPGTKADFTSMFTLPAGWRPNAEVFLPAAADVSVAGGRSPQISINAAGNVSCLGVNVVGLSYLSFHVHVAGDS